jgi:hypothetical protein
MPSDTAPFPQLSTQATFPPSRRLSVYAGRALSTLAVLFLTFDAAIKILRLPPAVQGSAELGFAASTVLPLGIVLLACVVLYAIPATSLLGAILLTGYLGGAIATHVRLGNPLFTHTLFPIYVAIFVWGGLFLRDRRLRMLLPFSRDTLTATTRTRRSA